MTRMPSGVCKAQHMQAIAQLAKSYIPRFAVVAPLVRLNERRLKVDLHSAFEGQAAPSHVALVLLRIERDTHS